MLRATSTRPAILAYFDAIKNLRFRQVALLLKSACYDPNLLVNGRGQNGLQFMINYFGSTDAHFRLQAPLNKAAYLNIARLLLNSGLDANTIDLLTGESVLFDAIRFNDKDMVALLLHYVDFSIRNKDGENALMCAARFGSKQVMRLLLDHLRQLEMDGYFLRQRNRFGLTALELARAENLECAKVLTKHLITFGQHTGAVLARSASHHQLSSTAAYLRSAPSAAYGLADVDSASEYEDPLGPYVPPHLAAAAASSYNRLVPRAAQAKINCAPYFNPKAAQFNQYLLEQQDGLGEQQQQPLVASGSGGFANSDENNSDNQETDGRYFGQAGALTRSRSCILNELVTPNMKQRNKYSPGGGIAGGAQKGNEKVANFNTWASGGVGRSN